VEVELLAQVLLCGCEVALDSGWGKKLVQAVGTGSHRRNLIAKPLDDLEDALGHVVPPLMLGRHSLRLLGIRGQ